MDVISGSWSLFLEMIPRNANKCASLIAKRLTKEHRFQSLSCIKCVLLGKAGTRRNGM